MNRPASWFAIGLWAGGCVALVVLLGTFSKSSSLVCLGAFGLVAVLVGIKYTSRHREWLVFALLLSEQFMNIDLLPEQVQRVGHYLLAILICLPALPYVRRYGILSKGGFRLTAIYFCWAALTLFYSADFAISGGRLLLGLLAFAAISVFSFEANCREDILKIFERVVLGCAVVTAVIAASAIVLPHEVTWGLPENIGRGLGTAGGVTESTRFRGIFGSPNQIGALTLVTVGSTLVCWPASRGWKRLAMAALMAFSLAFALLANSRTPLVALAIGGASYMIWRYRGRGVIICVALLLILSSPASRLLVPDDGGDSERDVGTLSGRTAAWQFAIEQVAEHPLTGFGYSIESQVFRSRYFPVWWGNWEEARMSVHNGYLGRAIGLGVPALLFWMFISLRPWFSLFLRKEDPWNLKPIALFVVVPMLLHNLTESSISDFAGLIGLVFGLAWAIAERQRLLAVKAQGEEGRMISQSRASLPQLFSVLN
jgi:O-antigen ligase